VTVWHFIVQCSNIAADQVIETLVGVDLWHNTIHMYPACWWSAVQFCICTLSAWM